MTDTTVVDWVGELEKCQGKKKYYTKALINKEEVCEVHLHVYIIQEVVDANLLLH